MIKYFEELEKRNEYYLPLTSIVDNGKFIISERNLSLSFIEKHNQIFSLMNEYIEKFKKFSLDSWSKKQIYLINEDYEKLEYVTCEYESIKEDLDYVLEEYSKINITSYELSQYLDISKSICSLFYSMYNNEEDLLMMNNIDSAILDLKNYTLLLYNENTIDNVYQPDYWYITPNNYLYNVGLYKNTNGELIGHKSRDISRAYKRMCYQISKDNKLFDNFELSNKYFLESNEIEKREYITSDQFRYYLNYISKPKYMSFQDGEPITYEKKTINIILGIINAYGSFYRFYEELFMSVNNINDEIEKINNWTRNDIKDILVRCCGFHKIESIVDKTITTSIVNYEDEFYEYLQKGWKINFVPPIIINKEKGYVEEYPEEFILIRKLLKK